MFAAVSFALFMALDGGAALAAKHVDTFPPQLAQVLEQARQDFELRYMELGLLGAAPLAGKEPVAPCTTEIASSHAEFDGAAQASAAAARGAASH
jgi:hypothetical protein